MLRRYVPLRIGANGLLIVAAWAFVALFLALGGWSFYAFWRGRTTIVPNQPATSLVLAGPYRLTRNPMYVGMLFLLIAWAEALRRHTPDRLPALVPEADVSAPADGRLDLTAHPA